MKYHVYIVLSTLLFAAVGCNEQQKTPPSLSDSETVIILPGKAMPAAENTSKPLDREAYARSLDIDDDSVNLTVNGIELKNLQVSYNSSQIKIYSGRRSVVDADVKITISLHRPPLENKRIQLDVDDAQFGTNDFSLALISRGYPELKGFGTLSGPLEFEFNSGPENNDRIPVSISLKSAGNIKIDLNGSFDMLKESVVNKKFRETPRVASNER